MGRKNIKLPEEEYEKHNERRQELGLTWSEYIDGQAPDFTEEVRKVIQEELPNDGRCRLCPSEATHGLVVDHDGDFVHVERYCESHAEIAAEEAEIDKGFEVVDGPAPLEGLEE